jgi:hypothetical protein
VSKDLKYTLTAEDRISDVLAKIKGNFGETKMRAMGVVDAFRSGGWTAGINALKNVQLNGLAAGGALGTLVSVINPVTAALAVAAAAGKGLQLVLAGIASSVKEFADFEVAAISISRYAGSIKEARAQLRALGEGEFRVTDDVSIGQAARVQKILMRGTGGAMGSAGDVKRFVDAAAELEKGADELAESFVRLWKRVAAGDEELGRFVKQLVDIELITPRAYAQLQRLLENPGNKPSQIIELLISDLDRFRGAADLADQSVQGLKESNADLWRQIKTELGEALGPAEALRLKFVEVNLELAKMLQRKFLDFHYRLFGLDGKPIRPTAPTSSSDAGGAINAQASAIGGSVEVDQQGPKPAPENKDKQTPGQIFESHLKAAGETWRAEMQRRGQAASDAAALGGANAQRWREGQIAKMDPASRLALRKRDLDAGVAEFRGATSPLDREKALSRVIDLMEKRDAASRDVDADKARKASEDEGKARDAQQIADRIAGLREQLAGQARPTTGSMDIGGLFQWQHALKAGRTPDEEIAENTRQMAKTMAEIKKFVKGPG